MEEYNTDFWKQVEELHHVTAELLAERPIAAPSMPAVPPAPRRHLYPKPVILVLEQLEHDRGEYATKANKAAFIEAVISLGKQQGKEWKRAWVMHVIDGVIERGIGAGGYMDMTTTEQDWWRQRYNFPKTA